jgi:hypothetical protein
MFPQSRMKGERHRLSLNPFLYLLFYFAVSLEVSLFLQDTIVIEYDHMTSMKGLDHNLM